MSTKDILNDPISKYTDHHMTVVESHLKVDYAAKVMMDSQVESVLVFENNDLIGIVTMKDIFRDVVAAGKDPSKLTLKEIAHKPIIKIHKDEKVKDAIAIMNKNDIRRLVVTNDERPIGIISQKAVIGNLGKFSAALPELELPDKVRCPYCSSLYDDKRSLSKHIDDIHIGKGLFEGNLAQANQLGSI
ncbi:MAG: cyclic nucleotide-binding/CBS domain-containing protein [Nitrosopumilaceae archaeon]